MVSGRDLDELDDVAAMLRCWAEVAAVTGTVDCDTEAVNMGMAQSLERAASTVAAVSARARADMVRDRVATGATVAG